MTRVEAIRVWISAEPVDPARVAAEVRVPAHGAEVVFTGVVRDLNDGRRVTGVSYDVFSPLAETILREICREAIGASPDPLRIAVVHRRGRLTVGEASIVIAVSSPHRNEAFEASRYVIEQIKVRAPVWKKEHYEDGDSEWLRGHALCSHGHTRYRSDPGGRALPAHGP